ncbi:hypothetical protein EV182_006430 [Spiromyces aspiralis]|uniref:Uncharacterized protein n=1 Tax=Spiromyces aspiralis TaxID=68401 RepID=A0ACC1HNG5_9FUNG|nr:hypothetical protein EV182_006430 [Spiromyces aspiralis]
MPDGETSDSRDVGEGEGNVVASSITTEVGGFLNPDCTPELAALHDQIQAKEYERHRLQDKLRKEFDAPSLKLASMPALGHYIEVSRRDARKLDGERFRMIQSLKGKARFESKEWTVLLSEIERLRLQLKAEEQKLFEELRDYANLEE